MARAMKAAVARTLGQRLSIDERSFESCDDDRTIALPQWPDQGTHAHFAGVARTRERSLRC